MSTRENNITAAGELLAKAWRESTTIDSLPEPLFPHDLTEAAAIQTAMAHAIGDTVVGWKVGGAPGPMVGRIFSACLYADTASLPAQQRHHQPGVECEIAFRLDQALPVRPLAYHREEVMNAATLVFTLELVGTRFSNGKHIPDNDHERLTIVADNSAGAGLIVGPEVNDWHALSLLEIPVELRIDEGDPMPLTPSTNRTDPVEILVWLANELSTRDIGLSAGQYVTTGSATLLQLLKPGSTAVARFGNFGEITVSLQEH